MKNTPHHQERYPYMFARKNMGIFIPTGWRPIFEKLCEDIDALLGQDKRGFQFMPTTMRVTSCCSVRFSNGSVAKALCQASGRGTRGEG
jgi:hypothetical protein